MGLSAIITLVICFGDLVSGYTNEQMRHLSPALLLEDSINSLMRLHDLSYKRSFGERTHASPAMELSDNLDDLISLQNIGKRSASSAEDQLAQQFNVMQHFATTGKKRSLSPATEFQQRLKVPQVLIDVGR
uniref:Uncharacterized protein n=1 Tax=Setaria digitata TaxID=48799 RepID=A0A915PV30_9BILA